MIDFVAVVLVEQAFENTVAMTTFAPAAHQAAAAATAAVLVFFFSFDAATIAVAQRTQEMAPVHTIQMALLLLLLRGIARPLHQQNPQPARFGHRIRRRRRVAVVQQTAESADVARLLLLVRRVVRRAGGRVVAMIEEEDAFFGVSHVVQEGRARVGVVVGSRRRRHWRNGVLQGTEREIVAKRRRHTGRAGLLLAGR